MVEMFSFKDALHDHLSIGFVAGCVACAQTQADLVLSKRAYASKAAKQSERDGVSRNAVLAATR